ncbi:MAG: GerMN domain-containing protein [Patescibacteria group bacterium]|nr:GerMN domain-containing protein [Patescibacteria group bacterium]
MRKIFFILFIAIALGVFLYAGALYKKEAPILEDFEVHVTQPLPGEVVESPISVRGRAFGTWFFEGDLPVSVLDADKNLLGISPATALGEWMTEDFVSFEAEISFEKPKTATGFVRVMKDNPSGLSKYDNHFDVPVRFDMQAEIMKVQVYFSNTVKDPGAIECNNIYAIEREIPKTQAVARAALEELLKGPSESEKRDGYLTNINSGVKIKSLVIENGTAKVEFDAALERGVGGSCRVTAIRSQIEQTLMQFSSVVKVIISINGRTEDILQP